MKPSRMPIKRTQVDSPQSLAHSSPSQASPSAPQSVPKDRFRMLLPTGRVAEFKYPTVEDALRLESKVIKEALRDTEGATQASLMAYMKQHMAHAAWPALIVGITDEPVPLILRESDREKCRARVLERRLAQVRKLAHFEQRNVREAELAEEALCAADHPDFVFEVENEMMDVDAMGRSARPTPVGDLEIDTGTGYVGAMRAARLGSPEYIDYRAMLGELAKMLDEVPVTDPKAPRLRPARRCSSS